MAFSEDNSTSFSDPAYQYQTFPHTDLIAVCDVAPDIAPLSQGEEGLWFDNSAALLPVDGLAGVGQALHLADAFAGRTGSLDTNVFLGRHVQSRYTAMEFESLDLIPPFSSDRSVYGEYHATPADADNFGGLFKADGQVLQSPSSMVSSQSPINTGDGEGPFKCPQCPKLTRRRCELK
jgi:hypothetical protein